MDNVVDVIQRHNSTIQGGSGTVASMGLEKTSAKALGNWVTPAVWALNYKVNGAKPDAVDWGLWGLSWSAIGALPATIVSLFKAAVEDKTNHEVRQVKLIEGAKYAPFILPCSTYSYNAPQINAISIASKGGTAWRHPNGVWVYILDSSGKMVHNFTPKVYERIIQPTLPLKIGSGGRYAIHTIFGKTK